MFGYIRPYKADLRLRDFTHYRALYCGICKTISRTYGQVPRLSTNYDLTFMALLLMSFSDDDPVLTMDTCILNPVRKHGIADSHPILDYCAASAVLLSFAKIEDNIADKDKVWLNQSARLFFRTAAAKAGKLFPEAARIISQGMRDTLIQERTPDHETGAPPLAFGAMLAELLLAGLDSQTLTDPEKEGLKLAGEHLGQWIYYMDALEDLPEDEAKQEYNALMELQNVRLTREDVLGYQTAVGFSENGADFAKRKKEKKEACDSCGTKDETPAGMPDLESISAFDVKRMQAARALQVLEVKLDQELALLSYKRYGDIVANVACQGLYETRMSILKGQALGRL